MKVYIGPYKTWIGPFQIAEKILFWMDKNDDRVYNFGKWLATNRKGNDTLLYRFCTWIDSKKERKIKIRIDPYDIWNADYTIALVVLPMLKLLKEQKHGSPHVDDEDVPEHLRSTAAPAKENEWDTDALWESRWNWVLDEMIHTFECSANPDWEDQFYSGEHDIRWVDVEIDGKKKKQMTTGPNDTFTVDREGMKKAWERRHNGLRLFSKYYHGLWD